MSSKIYSKISVYLGNAGKSCSNENFFLRNLNQNFSSNGKHPVMPTLTKQAIVLLLPVRYSISFKLVLLLFILLFKFFYTFRFSYTFHLAFLNFSF